MAEMAAAAAAFQFQIDEGDDLDDEMLDTPATDGNLFRYFWSGNKIILSTLSLSLSLHL